MKKKKTIKRSKSALEVKYPRIPSSIKYALTPEQMYQLDSKQLEYGIEGYEVPRKYYDYHQVMWHKKREKILSSHRHIWPPEDWPRDKEDGRTKLKPKRLTYIDDIYKWCHSYYDPERAKELIDEKGIDVKEYKPPRKIDKRRRKDFLENEKKKEEWRKVGPHIQNIKMRLWKLQKRKKKNMKKKCKKIQ